jgi:peptidoglycan/xylan/chitin deacetylase (PgdA/CDA1 family)
LETTDKILLTFDLEEFDLPEEYKQSISKEDQIAIATEGLEAVMALLEKHNIRTTFFTTAYYAEQKPHLVQKIAGKHEVASHLYYHSVYNDDHILASKLKLQEIIGKEILGFRMPRLKSTDLSVVKEAGYLYDSSINPTYLPGRYNNLAYPTTLYKDPKTDLWEVPFSVAPFMRFPLFWLSFKNIPYSLYAYFCRQALRRRGCLHLYFHPWEFADLRYVPVPTYLKCVAGGALVARLDKLIVMLKKQKAVFCSVGDYVQEQARK